MPAALTCAAPYVPADFACTFTWHTRRHIRKTVRRTLFVSQDAAGWITVTRPRA
jgi:hypothetical protein